MAIPDYETIMLPLLRLASDESEHRFRDAIEQLASEFGITDAERVELLPSGTAPLFDNRVGWARTYLKQAGLLRSPKRGTFQITEAGRALLAEKPQQINVSLLNRYEAFREFVTRRHVKSESETELKAPQQETVSEQTPEDALAAAYRKLRENIEGELLDQVKAASPAFFERLVIDLLVAMGYGGSRQDAGRAIGRSGDGGIDGIIKEDKLGLDVIYIQAKRWEGSVGRPEIQKFAGALQGQRANKGVFITTSVFSRDAEEYANVISSKLILIDGERLASLMVDHNVGVAPIGVYELKRVDTDYFEGE
jgi:restriction system protein